VAKELGHPAPREAAQQRVDARDQGIAGARVTGSDPSDQDLGRVLGRDGHWSASAPARAGVA
jgi:hypothetical protein